MALAQPTYFALLLSGVFALACGGNVDGPSSGTPPGSSTLDPSDPNNPGMAPSDGVGPNPSSTVPGGPVSPTPEVVGPDGPTEVPAAPLDLNGEPYYARAIPLTNEQWARAVQDVLNLPTLPPQAESFLKPAGGFTLFPNNERVLEVTNSMRESYGFAATEIAADLLAEPGAVQRIAAGNDADTFVDTFGRRTFRRSLTQDEVTRYRELFDVAAGLTGDGTEFDKGASAVVEAMLQSPYFLYRSELAPTGQPLTGYEVASKLSFWILGTTPSDAMLDRAERGEFDTAEGAANLARELLDDPAATEMAVNMFAEMFKFVRYRTIVKTIPDYNEQMGIEAEEMSRRFFAYIYEQGLGLRDALTSQQGFAGPALSPLYGLATPSADTPVDLGPNRVGFFSQVPYLMLFGADNQSDAIHRGLFINFQVLCAELPEPNFELPEPGPADPEKTDRESIEALTGPGTCGESCHGAYINPLGFAFENFDGMGRWRDTDKGKPVDAASQYPFPEGGVQPFNGAAELMAILASSERSHQCFAKSIASLGLQRDIVESDQALLDQLAAISMSSEGSMKNLIVELAKTSAFRTREGATL